VAQSLHFPVETGATVSVIRENLIDDSPDPEIFTNAIIQQKNLASYKPPPNP
jgi:hypothetical protein